MTDFLDRSLDDLIQAKRSRGRGRGRGRARGRGARGRSVGFRRSRGATRGGAATYQRPRNLPEKWDHDMYEGEFNSVASGRGGGGGGGGRFASSKLLISNLDYGVSNADIKELFSEFGQLVKAEVHYDKSGRSLGTATVIYQRRPDSLKAIKQYNGVPLDGRPMTVQFMTAGVGAPVTGGSESIENGVGVRQRVGTRSWRSRGGTPRGNRGGRGVGGGTGRGRGRGGRGRGRGGRNKSPAPNADQLDAELDAWKQTSDAMET